MKLPICIYSKNPEIQSIWDQLRKLTEGMIDGFNINPSLLGNGLHLTDNSQDKAGQIVSDIADNSSGSFFRNKKEWGMELIVDITNTTYGKFCINKKTTPTVQSISIYPQTNGDAVIEIPGGELTLDPTSLINITGKMRMFSGTSYYHELTGTPTANRTITIPDATFTMAGININQTWNNTQNMSGAHLILRQDTYANLTGELGLSIGELGFVSDESEGLFRIT